LVEDLQLAVLKYVFVGRLHVVEVVEPHVADVQYDALLVHLFVQVSRILVAVRVARKRIFFVFGVFRVSNVVCVGVRV